MKHQNQNLKAVIKIKKQLSFVKVTDVAKILNCSRQNIYKHLNEKKAATANIDSLLKISKAIDKVIAANMKAYSKKLQSII